MQNNLVVLRGLPACGKTVYSLEWVREGYKRISKPDLALMMSNSIHDRGDKEFLDYLNVNMIRSALREGFNVVSDNYNLDPRDIQIADSISKEFNANIIIADVSEPLEVCLARDLERNVGRVGRDFIIGLYNKYYSNGKLKQ
jgi:predicted kinase